MARKVTRKKSATGAEDLSVINPDRTIIIAGRDVVMREYGFFESLELLLCWNRSWSTLRSKRKRTRPGRASRRFLLSWAIISQSWYI